MNYKNSIFILILTLLLFIIGCSNNVMLDEENSSLLNYDFKISNDEKIDNILSKQQYSYSTSTDKKFIAVIIYDSENAYIKQYLTNNNETLDLSIPKNSNFLISLPANQTIAYTWNIKNDLKNNVIKFENSSLIKINTPKSEKGKDGVNYDRQNFYYKSIESGNQNLILRYEHQTEERDDFFDINLNIIIE